VADQRQPPGWREVILVAIVVVAAVLGAAIVTAFLPAPAQDIVLRTPLVIVVLVVVTVGLLAWLARRPSAS
jgi:hypothetical protein